LDVALQLENSSGEVRHFGDPDLLEDFDCLTYVTLCKRKLANIGSHARKIRQGPCDVRVVHAERAAPDSEGTFIKAFGTLAVATCLDDATECVQPSRYVWMIRPQSRPNGYGLSVEPFGVSPITHPDGEGAGIVDNRSCIGMTRTRASFEAD